MGKITVKHYLNVNLKPYIINKEKYYSIYLLITVNRQNTKVKSLLFNEYYTEDDFNKIMSGEDEEDKMLIENEVKTIENIITTMLERVEDFDTLLFSALYNYYDNIYITDFDLIDSDISFHNKSSNAFNLNIDDFYGLAHWSKDPAKQLSLFYWFSPQNQKLLREFLDSEKRDFETDYILSTINSIVFVLSFNKLKWILVGSGKKYQDLKEKYSYLFDYAEDDAYPLFCRGRKDD